MSSQGAHSRLQRDSRRQRSPSSTSDGASQATHPPQYQPAAQHVSPEFATVGNGQMTRDADMLRELLTDSGYGTSIAGDSILSGHTSSAFSHDLLMQDMPTPPIRNGDPNEMTREDRKQIATQIHQLAFNQNRTILNRAIGRTIELLKELQRMNSRWPAHYPTMQQSEPKSQIKRPGSRPGLQSTQSVAGESRATASPLTLEQPERRPNHQLQRSFTAGTNAEMAAESSHRAETREVVEPRLITPQIAQEFSILKLDLKLGALSQAELVHSLEKSSVAALLDGKINQSVKHLLLLRTRIEDTSSKVLVTGDLNAGKSTFCNALLRRKILPEDQQPCTQVFCEVLDSRENSGIEEVHAVHKERTYDRLDESTYDVYPLEKLEDLVVDNERYTQAKVYVEDIRPLNESLLRNGVVDISLIDAPGLNMDSLKTTAVFARQEEIDVVVFVVSAENHFTLSAKEFIWNAAHEKAYIFMVVNRFDNIKDKQRCQKMILEQVAALSPRTFKESADLVHFVSSNAISMAPGSGGEDDGPGAHPMSRPRNPPDADGGADSESDDGKGKRKGKGRDDKGKRREQREKEQDFGELEAALRTFVLEKRARSKLAPARTYLLNVLSDVNTLASTNLDVAQKELERVMQELTELEPQFEESKAAQSLVSEDIDATIETTCSEIYRHTRMVLSNTIDSVSESDLGLEYPGLLSAFSYADDLKLAMLSHISESVRKSEENARAMSAQGVSSIKDLEMMHLQDGYQELTFRSDIMFKRKRDTLARQITIETEIWDLVDFQTIITQQEKLAGTGFAMTAVTLVSGRVLGGGMGWVDGTVGAMKVLGSNNLRRLIIPGMIAAVVAAGWYILSSIPETLPKRLSAKISQQLEEMDYIHINSERVTREVRHVLKIPAQSLRVGLQRRFEDIRTRREETNKVRQESEVARKYFANLVRGSAEMKRGIEAVDLESNLGQAE